MYSCGCSQAWGPILVVREDSDGVPPPWLNIPLPPDSIDRLQGLAKKTQRSTATIMEHSPSLMVQRNVLKPYANVVLAQNHAFNTGQRIAVWRALDPSLGRQQAAERGGPEVAGAAEAAAHRRHAYNPDVLQGHAVHLQQNREPAVMWINNIVCYVVRLVLHP